MADLNALMNFLNAQGGDSSGYAAQGGNSQPPEAPASSPGAPPPMPGMGASGGAPTGQPDQPQLGPRLNGIKGYLSNILYSMGEAAKVHAGLPTDLQTQQQQQQLNLQKQQATADIGYKQAIAQQFTMNPATPDEATAWGVPQGMPLTQKQRADLATKALVNEGKTDVQDLKNKGIAAKPQDPIKQALADAKTASDAGDQETFLKKINLAHQLASASKLPPSTEIGLITRANNGDQDAQKALDVLQQRRVDLVKARGAAMGQGRLWSLRNYMDPETGETTSLTGFDFLNSQQQGKHYIPVGPLPQDKVIAVQQLQSEAAPALKQVRDALPAFDNASDRAIFARVMKSAGSPVRGDEAGWMGTIANQALKENLSPEGQKLAIAEGRLAETLGRMRGVLGLQATDSAMALTMRLMPGASTPNSAYAKNQLDTLDSMITKAVDIPAFTGKKAGTAGSTPPVNRPPLGSFEKK